MKEADIVFPGKGFDCVICLGNSFAHLPDFEGDNRAQLQAIENFRDCLRPGGILVIDHRNYDHIVAGGKPPMKNIYYDVSASFCILYKLISFYAVTLFCVNFLHY